MGAMFLLDLPCLHNNGRGPAHNTFVFWTYTIQFTLTALMQYGSHHLQCREWMVAIFTINQINKTLVFFQMVITQNWPGPAHTQVHVYDVARTLFTQLRLVVVSLPQGNLRFLDFSVIYLKLCETKNQFHISNQLPVYEIPGAMPTLLATQFHPPSWTLITRSFQSTPTGRSPLFFHIPLAALQSPEPQVKKCNSNHDFRTFSTLPSIG